MLSPSPTLLTSCQHKKGFPLRILAPIIAVLVLITMFACSEKTGTSAIPADSRVSDNNVFSDQVRALEKAEQLEGQMMDAFNKRGASIDAQ